MRKDPTEFRERFAKWKAGEKVYEAGKISDQQYYDTMERVAEQNNAEWNKERRSEGSPELSVDEEFVRILNDNAYDYRGYYNKYPNGKGNAIDHWTDEFKTVYHPTFSIYSKYSGKKSQYNPEGILGGRWDGEKYIPAQRQKLPKYGGGKGFGGLLPINIPAVLRGIYNSVKERAYRTITPQDYNIPKATKEFVSGKNRNKQDISPARNEEWARYLGVPYEGESNFEPSPYRPQKGKTYDTVLRFKDESDILSDQVLNQMLEYQKKTGKNSQLIKGDGGGLGSYTISLGEDEKGPYISYYDDWDINPFKGISAKLNIPVLSNIEDIVPGSNPYTVYGRRYYQKR